MIDPRAIRASVTRASVEDLEPLVIEPAAMPVGPVERRRALDEGGARDDAPGLVAADDALDSVVLVNGDLRHVHLDRSGRHHATLVEGSGPGASRTPVVLLDVPATAGSRPGVIRREVLVDGWTIAVDLESERLANLRERARRGREDAILGGPAEIRAVIPGRVVSVSVAEGETVMAGQRLLVVEAMKMQNEVRAPRDGTIGQLSVGAGQTIELGDLLLVLT